ncbi:hypothetical protein QJS04_geneDACA013700 [Acorus gramineus]|uniref:RecA family profile 1 domain-containing protein n=1 Tax=Acorus gramineus TaxID=55184 RepID=A0AAV9B086_ACOGR|nr:hypothetical protein QJS04_geneDACA013700 [Acorus gramineus]
MNVEDWIWKVEHTFAKERVFSARDLGSGTSHFRDFSAKDHRYIWKGSNHVANWLGRSESYKEVPVISSGSLAIDTALGIGGFPKERVVEIYGPEASGKTTLALHVVAEAQKQGVDPGHYFKMD